MPIYEYECEVCGNRLEKLQKVSEQPLTDCPACGQPTLRKLLSPVAFRLKGGGWYETDFKDEKSRRNVAKEDEKTGDSEAAKGAGADTKQAGEGTKTDAGGAGKETPAKAAPAGGDKATSSSPAA